MNNNIIRLTESDLHTLIEEAVKTALNEMGDRSEYWKQRWAKQKEEGTVPDRSKYWKERAQKQKAERLKKQKQEKKTQNKRINKATKDWEWLQWHRRTFGDPDPEWEGDYSYGDFYPGDND